VQSRIITSSAPETRLAGSCLAECLQAGDVVLLTGDLGAGKTVLAKGVAQGLGIEAPVTSPTFNILLVYRGRLVLNHFDLYRLDDPQQLTDVDYYGTLESGGVSLVEWGDRFPASVPAEHLVVALTISGDTARDILCTAHGSRSGSLLRCWSDICRRADLHVDSRSEDT
jgi:tRNA threonylcarbamoyladenosine biosynthesis protein TsaE